MLALLILAVIGLVVGALLALSIKRGYPYGDERVDKIIQVLPGINCTACGYEVCGDFARAVAEGRTSALGCIPGDARVAHAVADILGIVVSPPEEKMAIVRCKGGHREAAPLCIYEGLHDCRAMILTGSGSRVCGDGCLGEGNCARVCPFDAITINANGVAVVAAEKCTGCGLCLAACPRTLIELIPRVHKIFCACSNHDHGARVKKYCAVGCTACTICAKVTPHQAIVMQKNLPQLDYTRGENFVVAANKCPSGCFVDLVRHRPKVNIDSKCIGCAKCVAVCPVTAITGEKDLRHSIDKERCIGCGLCLSACPVRAISLWGGLVYGTEVRRKV